MSAHVHVVILLLTIPLTIVAKLRESDLSPRMSALGKASYQHTMPSDYIAEVEHVLFA
jgi:hypothetical protein